MKDEASRARQLRLAAAKRLIKHAQHEPPTEIQPKPPKQPVRRMVPPMEVAVKVVTA